MAILGTRVFMVIMAAYILTSCAVGNTYDFRAATPSLKASASRSISVGVLDRRPYVLSSNKPPSFVGLQRGGYANPFDVNTVSGGARADEFAAVIASGYKAKVTLLPVRTPEGKAIDLLKSSSATRLLLVSILEWKTDTYLNVALHFNLVARVYDASGQMLGENRISGKDNLGGPIMVPSEVGPMAAAAAKRKFEELLNAAAIQQSLQ